MDANKRMEEMNKATSRQLVARTSTGTGRLDRVQCAPTAPGRAGL
jgi:hypothetical protein